MGEKQIGRMKKPGRPPGTKKPRMYRSPQVMLDERHPTGLSKIELLEWLIRKLREKLNKFRGLR